MGMELDKNVKISLINKINCLVSEVTFTFQEEILRVVNIRVLIFLQVELGIQASLFIPML